MLEKSFALFAPHTEHVALVGSWLENPLPMNRDETGTWRISSQMPDGRHTYKFRLNSLSKFMLGQEVDVTDPLAREIDEMQGDAGVIVVQNGQDVTTAFDWQHDDKPLPQDDELVIYELHVGEFGWKDHQPGTFSSVIERLDYLRELGVNAVELMPVSAFPMGRSWGYNVRHACAVEPAYGGPRDLKRLVDECHARGIRVLLDVVFNHTESESPLTRIDFYYWFRDPRPDEQSFGPKLDYERMDDTVNIDGQPVHPARKHGLEVALYWLREYHIDGYRLDATAVLNNFDFIRELRAECKTNADGKPFYIVAEQLPEDPSVAGPDAPADGAWHLRFRDAMLGALTSNGDNLLPLAEAIQPRNHGYVSPARVVNYIESHDEFTLMQRLEEAGITGDAAFRRNKLAATLLFTSVGNPMLYQGEEFGGYRPRDLEVRPLQWELLSADYGLELKTHYAWAANLRHDLEPLTSEDLSVLYAQDGWLAFSRDDAVMVVANMRDQDRTSDLPFPDGAWHERSFNADLETSGGKLNDPFPASHAKIFVRR